NDDMESRQRELELLTTSLVAQHRLTEHERARLAAVLTGLRDAIVVVDESGQSLMQNEAYADLAERDQARDSATDGVSTLELGALRQRVAAGETFTTELWRVDE